MGDKLKLDLATGINALRYASGAYQALGEMDLVQQCKEAAREMCVVLTGSVVGGDEILRPAN